MGMGSHGDPSPRGEAGGKREIKREINVKIHIFLEENVK